MHLSDTLTLIDDALRESKIMLEIYAKPADSAAWAAIQKSHRAVKALQELIERDLVMVSRVPTAKMRLEGLMAFIEAVVQNHKRNPCDKQDYNEQEMREYKALRLGQTIHTSYELDAAWKAMIEAAIAE